MASGKSNRPSVSINTGSSQAIINSDKAHEPNVIISAFPERTKYFQEVVSVNDFGPPVLIKETILTYKQFRQRIRELEMANINYDQITLFFIGTPDKNGRSWHADSNSVERAVNYLLKKLGIQGYFLKIYVGTRDEWLDLDNPYKMDPKINLLNIPTLWVWNSSKRIFGKRCFDMESIYLLLKD
ncbi:unnamed protein product [Orchesella dallaii]|uniref:Thioredoxin domain-containing protein n=1 Tax=Orchesella dallaii TaxID=48710 RepID=A0ABP1Q6Q3_9HEXA